MEVRRSSYKTELENISMFSLGGLVWGVTIWLPGRQAGPCWWPRCQTRSCPCSCPDWRTLGIAGSRQRILACLSAVTAVVLGWAELISLLTSIVTVEMGLKQCDIPQPSLNPSSGVPCFQTLAPQPPRTHRVLPAKTYKKWQFKAKQKVSQMLTATFWINITYPGR